MVEGEARLIKVWVFEICTGGTAVSYRSNEKQVGVVKG